MDPKKYNLKCTKKAGIGGGQALVSLKHITLDKISNYVNRLELWS